MSIAVVTDSTADLPSDLAAAFGITVVPLEIRLGAQGFRDGLDLTTGELFRRLDAERLTPLTSQPSLGVFAGLYRRLLRTHDGIVSIHIADCFSGTYDTARLAASSLPGARISVIDSGTFTLGLGLQVLRAAEAARQGRSREEIVGLLRSARRQAQIIGVLDTLDYLRMGGRISRVGHLLGTLLKVKPIIRVGGGEANAVGLVRRREQAAAAILERLVPILAGGRAVLGVIHTLAAQEAEELRSRLEARYWPIRLLVEAGPVVGCHVGPRALGVAVLPV